MQTSEALRSFFGRVTPAIPELFNMAYAICGNYDLAAYALQYALMDAWLSESGGGMGFREGLRHSIRRVAMEAALHADEESTEFTWDGLSADCEDPVLKLLSQESQETRRCVALRFGCGLSVKRIARLTELSTGRVRELLDRFERMIRRKVPNQKYNKADVCIAKAVSRAFSKADAGMPSMGAIYRSFEAEAQETRRPSRLLSKIFQRVTVAVLALLCALMFWLAAALMQPAPLEEPAAIVTEEGR